MRRRGFRLIAALIPREQVAVITCFCKPVRRRQTDDTGTDNADIDLNVFVEWRKLGFLLCLLPAVFAKT